MRNFKKLITGASLLAMVCTAGCSNGSTEVSENMNRIYTNDEAGLTITVPAEYTAQNENDYILVNKEVKEGEETDGKTRFITVQKSSYATADEAAKLIYEYTKAYEAELFDRISEPVEKDVNGVYTKQIEMEYTTDDDMKLTERAVIFNRDDSTIIVDSVEEGEFSDDILDAVNLIVETTKAKKTGK